MRRKREAAHERSTGEESTTSGHAARNWRQRHAVALIGLLIAIVTLTGELLVLYSPDTIRQAQALAADPRDTDEHAIGANSRTVGPSREPARANVHPAEAHPAAAPGTRGHGDTNHQ